MPNKFNFPARLDKFLSNAGYGSRKDIRTAVKFGWVEVNGIPAISPDQKISESDRVLFRGEWVTEYHHFYWVFNKPAGYVCSNYDPEHPTIFELIDHPHSDRMQIVGRLDLDVTGLVILTTDGEFNHILTSPKHKIVKLYQAELTSDLSAIQINSLLNGILIDQETTVRAVSVRKTENKIYEIGLTSGQHHVVKKMIAGIDAELLRLRRIAIGAFQLPEDLPESAMRELTTDEVIQLKVRWNR